MSQPVDKDRLDEAVCRVVHPHLWIRDLEDEACDRCSCAAAAALEELRAHFDPNAYHAGEYL